MLVALAIAPAASAGSLAVTTGAKHLGVYGLEVTVGSSCVSDEDAVLTAQTVSGFATFEGCNSITAGAGGFTVTGTGDATFTAGNWIALESGFSVLSGGVFTAEIDAALTPFAWVQDDSPASETSYNVEFYVNLDGFTLGGGDELDHFVAYGGGNQQLRLVITSGAALVLEVRTDAGTYTSTSTVPTVAGWNKVEVGWTAGAGATISLTVADGTPAQVVANTATGRIDSARWGAVGGTVATSSGTILQDDFTSWR